jgi:hypothetical protein
VADSVLAVLYIKICKNIIFSRLKLNAIQREYLVEWVERDYILEKKAAVKEYEEKKIDLKENLLTDMEEKRKIIESDRHTMELTGDSMEVSEIFILFYIKKIICVYFSNLFAPFCVKQTEEIFITNAKSLDK